MDLSKVLDILVPYPTWVKIIIILLILVLLILLVFFRNTDVTIDNTSFKVHPINAPGENIFKEDKDKKGEFFVTLHFNFWTNHNIEIINIELLYDLSKTLPLKQKIMFDNEKNKYEPMDASYRMINRRQVTKDSVINIRISRRFNCNQVYMEDYKNATVKLEVSSPDWKGLNNLTIQGKLQPGGVFKNPTVKVNPL
jgi:hypothetical protein